MLSGTPQGGVISPLLSNIYLHVLDSVWTRRYAHLGTLVRYADDFVVMCQTRKACEEAERRIREILKRLKLEVHPDKTTSSAGHDLLVFACAIEHRIPVLKASRTVLGLDLGTAKAGVDSLEP